MTQSEILFAITLGSFCIGILGKAWQLSQAVAEMRHHFQVQDLRIQHIIDMHNLAFNGFRERIEHSTSRFKLEVSSLDQRLDDIEGFLAKSTEFSRRK